MNPFFEQRWRDAHTRFITYLNDTLQERLPPDLVAIAEEEAVAIAASESKATYRPDVQVREPWKLKEPATAAIAEPPSAMAPPSEPIRVFTDEETERWVEIREASGRLVTALELISPTNKLETADRDRYFRRRRSFISGGANVVEIDLIRQGCWLFVPGICDVLRQKEACYAIAVFRAARPNEHEVYPVRLRERLPAIRVPLRPTDADVVVDLQILIDQCHERGRYHFLNYRAALVPPLAPEEALWAEQLLAQHDLLARV